jgi:hypothetical protein
LYGEARREGELDDGHLKRQREALAEFNARIERREHGSAHPSGVAPAPSTTTAAPPQIPTPSTTTITATSGPLKQQTAPVAVASVPQPTARNEKAAERRLRPPTDEMARLSMGSGGDVIVSRPRRRLRSLEEEMHVDETPDLKRKREDWGDDEEYDDEEGEEEEEEPKKRKGPTKRARDNANRRLAKRTGQLFNPPCERCDRTGRGKTCEKQQGSKACCHCYTLKQKCSRLTKARGKDEEGNDGEETAPSTSRPLTKRTAEAKGRQFQKCSLLSTDFHGYFRCKTTTERE